MRKPVILDDLLGGVLLGAEADEAVVIQIDFEGAVAGHEREDAQVVFEAVQEMGVGDVLGGD